MEFQNLIELREKRDFGEKINATFSFIRYNFSQLARMMLTLSLRVVIVCGILLSVVARTLTSSIGGELSGVSDAFSQVWLAYTAPATIISFLVLSIGLILSVALVYEFMLVYAEFGRDSISLKVVWQRARRHIVRLLISTLGNAFVFIIITLIFVSVTGVLAAFGGTGGAIAALFLGFFAFIGAFILTAPLLLIYIIQVVEKASYGKALSRLFQLVEGREWFSTAGIAFLMLVIYYFFQLIFSIPLQVLNFIVLAHGFEQGGIENIHFLTVLSYIIAFLGYFLTMPIFWIAMAFQYFNLVEKREMVGLISKIDQIGKGSSHEEEGSIW